MAYQTINGAPINGTEGGSGEVRFPGLDLVSPGSAASELTYDSGSAQPLGLGGMDSTRFAVSPAGVDVVESGQHTGLFEMILPFEGADLVSAGPPMTGVSASALGHNSIEFAPVRAQNGTDVAFAPYGVSLAHQGLHSAIADQPAPIVNVFAGSTKPLALGPLTMYRAGVIVDAAGSPAAALAPLRVGLALRAAGGNPLEIVGWSTAATSVTAGSAGTIQVGPLHTRLAVTVGGADVGRAGTHSANKHEVACLAVSATPFEFGDMPARNVALYARQAHPLQIAHFAVGRGASC